ncbi:MAG TPA: hypothetical protein VFU03_00895 [Gemmatimonadales bacterium]|nr:hypothetical protein [Gemmatimonadales bacterium]
MVALPPVQANSPLTQQHTQSYVVVGFYRHAAHECVSAEVSRCIDNAKFTHRPRRPRAASSGLSSRLVSGALKIFTAAVVMFLAILYLKLGYFVLFLLPLGAFLAVLLTRKQREGHSPVWSALVAVVAFCAAYFLVSAAAVQNRDETRQLRWEVVEHPGQTGSEVRLFLGGSDYLFFNSSELASYLRSRPGNLVTVSLPVTRILGCFQSVGPPTIEGWGVAPDTGYGSGGGPGPWQDHWWCP